MHQNWTQRQIPITVFSNTVMAISIVVVKSTPLLGLALEPVLGHQEVTNEMHTQIVNARKEGTFYSGSELE